MATESNDTRIENLSSYRVLLEELLSEAVVDDLRVAFIFGTESVDIAYLREDLLAEDMLPRVSELHQRATAVETMPVEETLDVYGEIEMAVIIREKAVELHFFGSDETGLVATADRTDDVVKQLLQV